MTQIKRLLPIHDGIIIDNSVIKLLGHAFPTCCMVIGQNGRDRKLIGTGVVVDHNKVLTAGHILKNNVNVSVSFARIVYKLNLVSQFYALKTKIHKDYSSNYRYADLGILEFPDNQFSTFASLRGLTTNPTGKYYTGVGYGDTNSASGNVGQKRKNYNKEMQIISSYEQHGNSQELNYDYDSQTQFVLDKGSCDRDSGGPVFTDSLGRRTLVGIMVRKNKNQVGPECLKNTVCMRIEMYTSGQFITM